MIGRSEEPFHPALIKRMEHDDDDYQCLDTGMKSDSDNDLTLDL